MASSDNVMPAARAALLPKPGGPLCGALQDSFPHKTCNRKLLHCGDHCCRTQCGDKVIEVWWPTLQEAVR